MNCQCKGYSAIQGIALQVPIAVMAHAISSVFIYGTEVIALIFELFGE